MLRTHTCGELSLTNLDQETVLCGWIDTIREHANVTFVMLRDRFGVVQIVIDDPDVLPHRLNREATWRFWGTTRKRPDGLENKELTTGDIEVHVTRCELIGDCPTLPLDPKAKQEVGDELRLKYRFLDLRRLPMLHNLKSRHELVKSIRRSLEDKDFIEIETPMFVRSTPEGSRDFLVPSRTFPHHFHALPQSPQLYKQLLMIGGVDRYFSFPRCFRDEDAKRGRQLVHTQIDLEMSFADKDDVFGVVEDFLSAAMRDVMGIELPKPFPRLTYDECMARFGLDKPDLRYGMELVDMTQEFGSLRHEGLKQTIAAGGLAKALLVTGCGHYSRKQISELEAHAKIFGLAALSTVKIENGLARANFEKIAPDGLVDRIIAKTRAKDGDLILIGCDRPTVVHHATGELRTQLARELSLVPQGVYRPLWVTDFPMFEFDEQSNSWATTHHMFSMPKKEHLAFMHERPGDVRASLYDIVMNGIELGSGSIRITDPALQREIMDFVGYPIDKANEKFGFLLDAYKFGAPQHAGIALGLDNLIMTMLGLTNIQDVIAFPNGSSGSFPLDGSPNLIEEDQWQELRIRPWTVTTKVGRASG